MTTMADKTNGSPSPKGKPSQKTNQTASQRTHCGPSCGPCWETFCGEERCCEVWATEKARRELAELLAGGGDDV